MLRSIKSFFTDHFKTLAFFALAGIVGGFCTGLFLLDSYPENIRQQIYDQGLNDLIIAAVTAIQAAAYGVILGAIGIALGTGIGLVKNEKRIRFIPAFTALFVAVIGGVAMIVLDILFFGRFSDAIMESYATKPNAFYIIGSVIYGGVIEEVMLRLFLMSLIAFILHKLFGKGADAPTGGMLAVANIITALLFAAGHIPATQLLLGITPMILLRCFLLNGGIGLMFGWLYRKFGLKYSMLAHAGCHVVSKLIWILYI